ncbi:carboxymuconolactone decarboxylase family protein [Phytomonospora endophytica]|uniref:AhpD family alkylhydroperoxidase n=1 Tax=Phytomonospora endophytica TaxID=714109 RepID=A0A841FHG5_9ACTN|nr:carboxymuconolactone decarboxylase family protein [Phytomonospora endophytica]MBB6035175.1 AhpD family alkylhydroperoxidase [Phytomonospora endophytica]GIG64076.1 alkyl hydroperoxide reductase AhpD [Phytomonospora endophytica]
MEARMKHPAFVLDGALAALQAVGKTYLSAGVSRELLEITNLRASQINGCAVCVEMHSQALKKAGETDEKIWAVASWREAPYFSEAERAALRLSEEMTRLADAGDVTDETWAEVEKHFDERQRAALVMSLSMINVWNRLNATTRQPSGQKWG